jgi:hypothetical protein
MRGRLCIVGVAAQGPGRMRGGLWRYHQCRAMPLESLLDHHLECIQQITYTGKSPTQVGRTLALMLRAPGAATLGGCRATHTKLPCLRSCPLLAGSMPEPRTPLRPPRRPAPAHQSVRNAVEMAVLSSVRHPGIVQAFACMPNVTVNTAGWCSNNIRTSGPPSKQNAFSTCQILLLRVRVRDLGGFWLRFAQPFTRQPACCTTVHKHTSTHARAEAKDRTTGVARGAQKLWFCNLLPGEVRRDAQSCDVIITEVCCVCDCVIVPLCVSAYFLRYPAAHPKLTVHSGVRSLLGWFLISGLVTCTMLGRQIGGGKLQYPLQWLLCCRPTSCQWCPPAPLPPRAHALCQLPPAPLNSCATAEPSKTPSQGARWPPPLPPSAPQPMRPARPQACLRRRRPSLLASRQPSSYFTKCGW